MNDVLTFGRQGFQLSLRLPEYGMPEFVAAGDFGKAGHGDLSRIERSSRINGMDKAVPSAVMLPTGGMGFFGWPAICGHRAGRDFILQFSGWKAAQDGEATVLSANDPIAKVDIEIVIATHAGGVISMRSKLTNRGAGDYQLDRCGAGTFLINDANASVAGFTGMWGREFQTRQEKLNNAVWLQESRRGRTSHDRLPMLFLSGENAAFGAALGWSGNHQIAIDRIDDGRYLLHLGELFEPGEILLATGQSYQSPSAYFGPDTPSFHAFVRQDLVTWPGGAMSPRPVTLNTWEGNYFDHQLDSLRAQALAAAELGIERFVLDDGWFGHRDDDTTGLGDWDVDLRKYPDGLKPLVDCVTGLGMQFGLWFEPEMVNPASRLFDAHPDWVLQAEGRPLLTSRHQLVLDLTRHEVSDHLFSKMDAILSNHAIAYIKWDMNRDLTAAGGRDGQARTSDQTRAVYALMDRIRRAHPDVEIESCASGGGRADYGVLAHTQRIWTSDCTDALERLEIQRGATRFFPPELLGSHVSAVPNHQTGRRHKMAFRGLVAMAYHFGVELNPLELPAEERHELASQIATHKRLRGLLHAPGANFSLAPVDGRYCWGAAGADRIVIFVAQGPQMICEQPAPLKLPEAITANRGLWRVSNMAPERPQFIRTSKSQLRLLSGEVEFSLPALSASGLPLPMLQPESAVMIELEPSKGVNAHG